jgi:hypothetical protein
MSSQAQRTAIAVIVFAIVGIGLAILSLGSLDVVYHGMKAFGCLNGSDGFFLFIGVFAGSFALVPLVAVRGRLVPLLLVWAAVTLLSGVAVSIAAFVIKHRLSYSPCWMVMPGVLLIPALSASFVLLASRFWRRKRDEPCT